MSRLMARNIERHHSCKFRQLLMELLAFIARSLYVCILLVLRLLTEACQAADDGFEGFEEGIDRAEHHRRFNMGVEHVVEWSLHGGFRGRFIILPGPSV